MPSDPYVASSNPARRAKQQRTATEVAVNPTTPTGTTGNTTHNHQASSTTNTAAAPRSILPRVSDDTAVAPPPHVPAKRGRKPGPLSRSARETQRKLNHSIIEKARRTKINEALATLRKLVPVGYGNPKSPGEQDDEESEDEDGVEKKKKKKSSGKREEKEKEFKLEILVRTVSFMQDLLGKMKVLEDASTTPAPAQCATCVASTSTALHFSTVDTTSSSKRRYTEIEDPDLQNYHVGKRPRRASTDSTSPASIEPTKDTTAHFSPDLSLRQPYLGSRLPPISSWLSKSDVSNAQIDPLLLNPAHSHNRSPSYTNTNTAHNQQQLPSPPSSTHFDPIQSAHVPPVPTLTLGPVAMLLSPHRTPEDESAASLLLQISGSSPPMLPSAAPPVLGITDVSRTGGSTSFDLSRMRTACITPVYSQGLGRAAVAAMQHVEAQTPGSMLGLLRRD